MAEPMETVAADAPFARPFLRQRVGVSFRRERGVKCSVEHRHMAHSW